MANNTPIQNFTELDFNTLKQSLKDYMSTRPEFVDYNFEGSVINILMDLLTYNTQQNAFYSNMLASEFFLDTAQKRDSVVSRANEIGYVPRSVTSASAIVTFVFRASNGADVSMTLPRNTIFTTQVSGKTYKFQTLDDYVSTDYADNGGFRYFTFEDVIIVEGTILRSSTIVDPTTINGIVIPNPGVDTSRLQVYVSPNSNFSFSVPYSKPSAFYAAPTGDIDSGNIVDLNENSTAYFLEEINDQLFRIYFGDGTIGKALEIGNLVTIDYLVSSGAAPNGASQFSMASSVPSISELSSYTVSSPAFGGAAIESTDSIRFNAPLIFAAQNRAVTVKDYIAIVMRNNPSLKAVTAWGGEDNDPQALGYVFISVKRDTSADPLLDPFLTNAEKEALEQDLLDNYCVASVIPIVVDPELLYIVPNVTVKYNSNILSAGPTVLENAVAATITAYADSDLDKFNQYFRYSKLSRQIDATDISINNNNISLTLQKRFEPLVNISADYTLKFANTLVAGTLSSTSFGYGAEATCYLDDDGGGLVRVYYIGISGKTILDTVGTINYTTGALALNDFQPTAYSGDIRITVTPDGQDIYPSLNVLLEIDPDTVIVNAIPDPLN